MPGSSYREHMQDSPLVGIAGDGSGPGDPPSTLKTKALRELWFEMAGEMPWLTTADRKMLETAVRTMTTVRESERRIQTMMRKRQGFDRKDLRAVQSVLQGARIQLRFLLESLGASPGSREKRGQAGNPARDRGGVGRFATAPEFALS